MDKIRRDTVEKKGSAIQTEIEKEGAHTIEEPSFSSVEHACIGVEKHP